MPFIIGSLWYMRPSFTGTASCSIGVRAGRVQAVTFVYLAISIFFAAYQYANTAPVLPIERPSPILRININICPLQPAQFLRPL